MVGLGEGMVQYRWERHQENFALQLKVLAEGNSSLANVTLNAGGQSLRAHSFILAAGSAYFRQVLEGLQPWQAPFLLLPQTPFLLLQKIVEFLYTGSVQVDELQVGDFLSLGKELKVAGINDVDCTSSSLAQTEEGEALALESTREELREAEPRHLNLSSISLRPESPLNERRISDILKFGEAVGNGTLSLPSTHHVPLPSSFSSPHLRADFSVRRRRTPPPQPLDNTEEHSSPLPHETSDVDIVQSIDESSEEESNDLLNATEVDDEVEVEASDVQREEGTRSSKRRSKCNICGLELSANSLNRHVRRVHEEEPTSSPRVVGKTGFSRLGLRYRTKALESREQLASKSFTAFPRERGPARLRKSFQQILERERKRSETSGRREHEDGGGDRLEQEGQIDFQEENILLDERSSGNLEDDGDVDSGVGSLAATRSSGTSRQPEDFQDNNEQVEADQPARATSSMLGTSGLLKKRKICKHCGVQVTDFNRERHQRTRHSQPDSAPCQRRTQHL